MKKAVVLFLFYFLVVISYSQTTNIKGYNSDVNDIKWGSGNDYKLYLTLSNDSDLVINVDTLFHSDVNTSSFDKKEFTYYPVNFSKEFVKALSGREVDIIKNDTINTNKQVTLWSAVHSTLGGGWVHFINSLLYGLETNQLSLVAPLMKRPESNWKPKPMTDSYKRTKKWKYYVPVNQKDAIKEYQFKKINNELDNLNGVPEDFINLFLGTSDKEYNNMKKEGRHKELARIDLVKLLLGSNYLSVVQINYIKSMVSKAVQLHTTNLPSVIILDDYSAAVIMTLDENGYHIENIEFRDKNNISDDEKTLRKQKIYSIINQINDVNKEILEQKLKKYFN